MSPIKFYLKIESFNYLKNIKNLIELSELIKFLKINDKIYVLESIFELTNEGKYIWDILNDTALGRDQKVLIQEILIKNQQIQISDGDLYKILVQFIIDNPTGIIGDKNIISSRVETKYVCNIEMYYGLKQLYLLKYNIKDICKDIGDCFKNLIFDDDICKTKLDNFSEADVRELMRILNVLDKKGRDIYIACKYDPGESLRQLSSITGTPCSGGTISDQKIKVHGIEKSVSCKGHFKIERKDSNKRLYFSWGIKEYDYKIIICHIGGHLM